MLDPDVLSWQQDSPDDGQLLRAFAKFRRAVQPTGAMLTASRATSTDQAAILAALNKNAGVGSRP